MWIDNRHSRLLPVSPEQASALLDGLAGPEDALWPRRWPPMRLDQGLRPGSAGGHGPVRYEVKAYSPGESVVFDFDPVMRLDGEHAFELEPVDGGVWFHHRIEARAYGRMLLAWPLAVRWLHDALLEDAFDGVARTCGAPANARWSPWVKLLRLALR